MATQIMLRAIDGIRQYAGNPILVHSSGAGKSRCQCPARDMCLHGVIRHTFKEVDCTDMVGSRWTGRRPFLDFRVADVCSGHTLYSHWRSEDFSVIAVSINPDFAE